MKLVILSGVGVYIVVSILYVSSQPNKLVWGIAKDKYLR
jgi:hypothetical protein